MVGSFLVTQAFYALLKKRDTRTIVNVSSGVGSIAAQRAGSLPVAGKVIAYASSKAALNMRARPSPALWVLLRVLWGSSHDYWRGPLPARRHHPIIHVPQGRALHACAPAHVPGLGALVWV